MDIHIFEYLIIIFLIVCGSIITGICNSVYETLNDKCDNKTLDNSLLTVQSIGVIFITVGVLQLLCKLVFCRGKKVFGFLGTLSNDIYMGALVVFVFVILILSSIILNELNKNDDCDKVSKGGIISIIVFCVLFLVILSGKYIIKKKYMNRLSDKVIKKRSE